MLYLTFYIHTTAGSRYTVFYKAPWPTECSLCPIGKINQAVGQSECKQMFVPNIAKALYLKVYQM